MLFNKTGNRTRRRVTSQFQQSFQKLEPRNLLAAVFSSFSLTDGSFDDTSNTTFESSSLSLDYDLDVTEGSLTSVQVFASEGSNTLKIGEYSSLNVSNGFISLNGFSNLSGTQMVFAIASTSDGTTATSDSIAIDVLATSFASGDFQANTFNYSGGSGSAYVYRGRGGTDTLTLNVDVSAVDGFNGELLSQYDNDAFVTSQAFYDGSVYDYMTLDDGSEIYMQGVERLEFTGGVAVDLTTRPNDPVYEEQWEHAIGDVADAWKFTRGSDEVLIVSLDTGTVTEDGTPIFSSDLDASRHEFFLTDPNRDHNLGYHGHASVTIMSATAGNELGIAGINQLSDVVVTDVYNGLSNYSINDAMELARERIDSSSVKRVVFQGGIQGEYWLNPNSIDQDVLATNMEDMLFAIAAGNGGQDISLTSNSTYSGGAARLEGTFENVMAIGALQATSKVEVNGLDNASSLNLASYSNYGENQTFAVSTNTRYIDTDDSIRTFGGTSNANPVMAGFSSLVWSVNTELTAGEVREIFAETAMDLGAAGRDTTYGWGTPDTGSAVRRAWALSQNPELANLSVNPYSGEGDGVTSVLDSDLDANIVSENALNGATFGITAFANDPNSGDAITFSLLDDAGGLFSIDSSTGIVTVSGELDYETATSHTISVLADSSDGSSALAVFSLEVTNVNDASLVDQSFSYRGSSFGDAVATDKSVLRTGQTATFANYTSYFLGINGFVIDVQDFNDVPTLETVGDFFEFSIGNDDNPSGWSTAPGLTALTYQANFDGTGTDRINLEWADNAIQNTWLEIKTLSNDSTGLVVEDAIYVGNAIGETGNDPDNAIVDLADVGLTRQNQTGFGAADIDNVYDFDRDGRVDLVDVGLARVNQSGFNSLKLITPGSSGGRGFSGSGLKGSTNGFTSFDSGGGLQSAQSSRFETRNVEPSNNSDGLVEFRLGNDWGWADTGGKSVGIVKVNDLVDAVQFDRLKHIDSAFSFETDLFDHKIPLFFLPV